MPPRCSITDTNDSQTGVFRISHFGFRLCIWHGIALMVFGLIRKIGGGLHWHLIEGMNGFSLPLFWGGFSFSLLKVTVLENV